MNAESLWRVRLGLFIVITCIYFLIPNYYSIHDFSTFEWVWGTVTNEGAFYVSPIGLVILLVIINPLTPLALGIAGCVLTRQCFKKKIQISKSAKILTQMSVIASLILILFLMANSYMTLDSGYVITHVNINAFCAFPVTIILTYISYDFPRFRATDFTLERPVNERTHEK